MTREYFIEKTSKVEQTFEDEFKAEFNSPECMWDNFLDIELWSLLNFINDNYKPFAGDWIRSSDDKIVNSGQILVDYSNSKRVA